MLERSTYRLRHEDHATALLVLDGTDSARQARRPILELASRVCGGLPASVRPRIRILGCNDTRCLPRDVARDGADWLDRRRLASSLLGPCLEEGGPYDATAILGAGPIHDLEDWLDSPAVGRLLLCSLGESLTDGVALPGSAEETDDATAARILRHLHDPPVRVWLEGDGFLPLDWQPAQWRLEEEDGAFRLALADGCANVDPLQFVCLTREGRAPRAWRRTAGGAVTGLTLETGPEAMLPEQDRPIQAPAALAHALRCAVDGRDYPCPLCGATHPAHVLRCFTREALLGEPLLGPPSGSPVLAVVELDGDSVRAEVHPTGVAAVGEREALMLSGGRLSRWSFFEEADRWAPLDDPATPLLPLGGGRYAVVL